MSLSLYYPATDSSSLVTPGITIPALTWSNDWAPDSTKNLKGQAELIQNITTPADTRESFMKSRTEKANVYQNTDVDRALWAPTTRGYTLKFSLNTVPYGLDSADATFKVALPISVNLTVTYPVHPLITAAVLEHSIARCIGGLYPTGATSMTTELNRAMRGALLPSDL